MSLKIPDETPRSSSKILRCAPNFNSLLSVSSGDKTLRLMFDIFWNFALFLFHFLHTV